MTVIASIDMFFILGSFNLIPGEIIINPEVLKEFLIRLQL